VDHKSQNEFWSGGIVIDELSKWKVSEMDKKIAAVTLPTVSVSQLQETLRAYIRLLVDQPSIEKTIRYDEHAKTCGICSWRKDINDEAPGYCKRWRELQ
jgi:hypothetical protein